MRGGLAGCGALTGRRTWEIAALAVVTLACLANCAHVFPSGCQPGEQRRDPDHRVNGVSDCYVCTDSAPGTTDAANHYRCTDYTCSECEDPPPGVFSQRRLDAGAYQDAP